MANLNLQTISSGTSLDDTTLNNNINILNTVPLTGTTLNNIPTFSEDEKITAKDINEAFAAIEDNWIDTSDATATENDMANGVTAYVNGEKIEGNIPEVISNKVFSTTYSYVDNWIDSTVMNVRGVVPSDTLCRSDSVVNIPVPASEFGDATAANVAVGKTFTSSAGLNVTGTGKIGRRVGATVHCERTDYEEGVITITLDEPINGVIGGGLYDSVKRSASASSYAYTHYFYTITFVSSTRTYIRAISYNWDELAYVEDYHDTVTFKLSSDGTQLISTGTIDDDLLYNLDFRFNEFSTDNTPNGSLVVY